MIKKVSVDWQCPVCKSAQSFEEEGYGELGQFDVTCGKCGQHVFIEIRAETMVNVKAGHSIDI